MSRRAVRVVVVVAIALTIIPVGAPPGFAFTESSDNNFFGTDPTNNTGTSNSFFGGDAGVSNTDGSDNSFFGRFAGTTNETGDGNAFFGHSAGNFNTGDSNSFFGDVAGLANTTGIDNSFFGRAAGLSNTTASNNSFFGREAGASNTIGGHNSFFGRGAGRFNTTASLNAFFGFEAGNATTTGGHNAFFGEEAGRDNTIGETNSFFGAIAGLRNTSGDANTFVGADAGTSNTTGVGNTVLGAAAGGSNTTEHFNTYIGTASDGVGGITNATALGHQAFVSQSNSLVLGRTGVNVGIGTSAPANPLHVRRDDGTAKVLVEEASGTTLGRELFQLTNNGAARFRVRNTNNGATWDFQSSGGGGSFVIDRVGGPVALDFEIQPDGDAVHLGTVTAAGFITSSDRNRKTDITRANARKLMAMLRQLDISTWRFKNEPRGTVNLGPMAQDFHRLFGMGTETTIDVRDLAALALVGIQALDERLASMEGSNE